MKLTVEQSQALTLAEDYVSLKRTLIDSREIASICRTLIALAGLREGCVMVPIKADSNMLNAGAVEFQALTHRLSCARSNQEIVASIYLQMLAAAPKETGR